MIEKIKVVQSQSHSDFEDQVNYLLGQGYDLHGEPQFRMVSCQDSWEGRQRAWTKQLYVQVLKKANES